MDSKFSPAEIAYLQSQPLARIATVAPDGQPDVAAVGYTFDGTHFLIGGANPTKTLKYKNVQRGNPLVALTIDDLETVQPWKPRGIKIHGVAEALPDGNLRIRPVTYWSWGVDGPVWVDGRFAVKKVSWESTESQRD